MVTNPVPDSQLRLDAFNGMRLLEELPRDFFRQDTAAVARELIGYWIARRYEGSWYGARIVETEAYLGVADPAAHSWRGRRTQRVEPMYMDGGHLYVFLVYGMHHCANIVTREEGVPEAVLLRGAEGPQGAPAKLLSGPGRLCAALGITRTFSGLDMLAGCDVCLLRDVHDRPDRTGISKRIGVDYAGEAAAWPLRFFDRDSPAVSGPALLNQVGKRRGTACRAQSA
ncbi:MAG: DNA-3-methyladenine glycosylase [Acidobacteriota bacterium]|jgi:DNA-3-methyladenine glycosylase|nr:DNA-3-methyladenine glycosylase [Acidobacteriota bacterium]